MITLPTLPKGTTNAWWFRNHGENNRTGYKDWVVCKTPSGIITLWGEKDQLKNQRLVDPSGTKLYDFIRKKEREGYWAVGYYGETVSKSRVWHLQDNDTIRQAGGRVVAEVVPAPAAPPMPPPPDPVTPPAPEPEKPKSLMEQYPEWF